MTDLPSLAHSLSIHNSNTLDLTEDAGSSVYWRALQHWQQLQSNLIALLESYHGACITLQSLCTQPPLSLSEKIAQKTALETLESELPSVLQCENQLNSARTILQSARNASHDLVPLSSLPNEILARVFHFAVQHCAREVTPPGLCPSVISGVCKHWRQTVLGTASLWSHIDIDVGVFLNKGPFQRAKTWLERLQQGPVHLHIDENEGYGEMYEWRNYYPNLIRNTHVIALLEPYASQFSSLTLRWSHSDSELMCSLMRIWFETGSPRRLKSIALRTDRSGDGDELANGFRQLSQSGYWSPGHPNPLLVGVTSLSLDGLYFPFSSGIFHGLLELDLQGAPIADPSSSENQTEALSQLIRVLNASPKLRVLTLGRMKLQHPDQTYLRSIQLNDIEKINLRRLDPESSCVLLSLLSPGRRPLSLFISPSDSIDVIPEVLSLLDRSTVSILCLKLIDLESQYCWLPLLCHPRTRIQRLVLYGFSETSVPDLTSNSFALPELYLMESEVSSDSLRRLLVTCSTRSLHIWSCSLGQQYWLSHMPQEVAEAEAAVKEVVQRFVIHETDFLSEAEPQWDNPLEW